MPMHQSFISYKKYRYAVYAMLLSLVAITAYVLDSPRQPSNGGTWLGYTLGTLSALIIVFLMCLGVRKRSYHSSLGSVTGWLSAHVYLGFVLLLLATLHSGFQFGWNIHTLTYALMCLVITSGCWGIYAYRRYPELIVRQSNGLSREIIFQNLKDLDTRALSLVTALDAHTHYLLLDAIRRSTIGGNFWAQLSAYDGSKMLIPNEMGSAVTTKIVDNKGQQVLIEILAAKLANSSNADEINCLQELLETTGKRAVLLGKLQKIIQLQSLLQFWLYLHIPLSFALLSALIIHITSVFIYW
ncbi:MAG: hypothetical protein K2Q13_12310 [Nitrosomonas sp.]|uniref:hypothetical protein n=1 Tax=Nitrosomonas sp. TaxID=42353 RepID=UPI0025DD3B2F|nr:hypothetical protein [Nitrosomonas sp.]MBY0475825.1 hypothetical protein [Nitrosomonas sp.]